MKSIGALQVDNGSGSVQRIKKCLQSLQIFVPNPSRSAFAENFFEPLVGERLDRHRFVPVRMRDIKPPAIALSL
jgi:hypothetical protein